MTQSEKSPKAKRSKADLYKLSDPHKYEDTEGEYWSAQSPEENENHRPRKNVSRKK